MQSAAIGPSSDFRRALGVPAAVRRRSARARQDATLLSIECLYYHIFVVLVGVTGDDGDEIVNLYGVGFSARPFGR